MWGGVGGVRATLLAQGGPLQSIQCGQDPAHQPWAWAWATRRQAAWGWARADCWTRNSRALGSGGSPEAMSFNPLGDVSQHPAWVGFRFHAYGHEAGRRPLRGPVRGWGHGS